jgi:hypothetical protein
VRAAHRIVHAQRQGAEVVLVAARAFGFAGPRLECALACRKKCRPRPRLAGPSEFAYRPDPAPGAPTPRA